MRSQKKSHAGSTRISRDLTRCFTRNPHISRGPYAHPAYIPRNSYDISRRSLSRRVGSRGACAVWLLLAIAWPAVEMCRFTLMLAKKGPWLFRKQSVRSGLAEWFLSHSAETRDLLPCSATMTKSPLSCNTSSTDHAAVALKRMHVVLDVAGCRRDDRRTERH